MSTNPGPGAMSGDAQVEHFVMKVGDTRPVLDIYLQYADGTPYDLSQSYVQTIQLIVAPCVGGRRIIGIVPGTDGLMAKVSTPGLGAPYTDGHCQFQWQANTLVVGEYWMEIIVNTLISAVSGTESFPRGKYYKLIVLPHL